MAERVHTITADPAKAQMPERILLPEGATPFDSGDLFSGQRWVHTFDTAGTYTYFCRYHEMEEMVGVITVTA
jgi:plastocyanin